MTMHSGWIERMRNKSKERWGICHMDKRIIKFFLQYLKPYFRTLFLAVFMMGIVALVNVATPYLSKIAIDRYIIPGDKKGLHFILVSFIVMYAVYWFASCWGSRFSIRLGQQIVADIRRDLFEHISFLSMDFFSKNKTGEILSRIMNDVNALLEFLSAGVVNLLSDIFTLIGIVIIMWIIHPKLAAVSLITVPIVFFGTLILGNHTRKAYGFAREKVSKLNAGAEENISGVRVVQAMSRESDNAEAFEKLNRENLHAQMKAIAVSAFFFPFMSLTNTLGTALVLFAGGIMIAKGTSGITVGELIAFIGYTNQFFVPLSNMSQAYNLYQNAAASAGRIYEYFEIKPTVLPPENPKPLHRPVEGRVEFCNVSFQYEPNQTVIK
ncbi:MAG TPA: ABC transporter ATP-binding protein, partial [Clostridiales bacterium]|nr:ABC transporter ATP-binding protein [Clostridiales bacterium]